MSIVLSLVSMVVIVYRLRTYDTKINTFVFPCLFNFLFYMIIQLNSTDQAPQADMWLIDTEPIEMNAEKTPKVYIAG